MGIRDFFKKRPKEKAQQVPESSTRDSDGIGRILFQTRWNGSALSADNSLIQKVAERIIQEDPFCKPFGGLEIIEGQSLGKLPAEQWNEISPYYGKNDFTAFVYVTGGRYKSYSDASETVETAYTPYDLDIFVQFE
ncbi:MAG: hypothetical protein PWP61_1075 [Trichococcus sp.]|nr:hypothetical protein [Trichococcus sp.]